MAAAWELLDRAPFLELGEHLVKRTLVRLLEMEAASDLLGGGWARSKLQKTQDVIEAELWRAVHERAAPTRFRKGRSGIFNFFREPRNFF